MGSALRLTVDQCPPVIAAVREAGAVSCSISFGTEPMIVCCTDEPRWWPRIPVAIGSVVTIDFVTGVQGQPSMEDASAAGFSPMDRERADERARAEEALPPPSTFRCFRVSRGAGAVLAGVRRGALSFSASLTQSRRLPEGELELYGLDTLEMLHHRWLKERFSVGDSVTVEILQSDHVDRPFKTSHVPPLPRRSGP